jgi:hypothetical protein
MVMTLSAKKIFLGLALVGVVTILPRVQGWNDASRMAMIQSLVDYHSLAIDHSTFADTGDKVFINGHFYSDKLVLPALIGAIVYLPLSLLGIKLGDSWNLAYYLITLFTVKAFWLVGLVAFYQALGFTGLTDNKRLWLTLALGVGSLYFTWSVTFNNHSLAASWLAIGFYFLLKAKHSDRIRQHLFFSGLFFALAGSSDVPIIAFYAGFLLYVVADRRLRAGALFFLLPLPLACAPVLAVNYTISGSIIPVQIVKSYFMYPGSPWVRQGAETLSGTGINQGIFLVSYGFNIFLGSRGFIFYNPMLFIAIPLLVRELKPSRLFAREARVVGLASALIVLYYLLFSMNYGGASYSFRWFVPLLPLWFFFIYPLMEDLTAGRKALFASLFAISTAIAVIGLINPWSKTTLSPYPLVANIKQIVPHIRALLDSRPAGAIIR